MKRVRGAASLLASVVCMTGAVVRAAPVLAQSPPASAPRDSAAQRPAEQPPARPERGDSVRPRAPVTPGGAFLRSLAIPGWGQARLGRNVTGGMFLLFEGMAGAMVWKANWQLEWARTRGKFVASHRQEREDWIVLLVFNHLMAGAEAYVSALLYDFPAALRVQRLPDGAAGVGVVVPLR